ncbi:hypothetical protein AAFC00_005138 [Neodothiora populina]|uniref:Uncharacterized protein n=1 Tax=Neodothiora populina TaxID=2781224 RepID=A0ABR3PKB6_9PEZI
MTYRFKQRKSKELENGGGEELAVPAAEEGLDSMQLPRNTSEAADSPKRMHSSRYLSRDKSLPQSQELQPKKLYDVGMPGLGSGLDTRSASSTVGNLLDGYYDLLRKAIAVVVIGRTSLLTVLFVWLVVKSKRRRRLAGASRRV